MTDGLGESPVEVWVNDRVVAYQCTREEGLATSDFLVDATRAARGRFDAVTAKAAVARLRQRIECLDRLQHDLAPEQEPGSLQAGDELGDFVVERLLAQGGMGQVFSARQKSVERRVALKVPFLGSSLPEKDLERFRREVAAAARVRHTGVVPIYAIGEHNDLPFYAMEFVEGRALSELLRELDGRQPSGATFGQPGTPLATAVARLGTDLLRAIEAAHAEGVIHRDLKPGNVMLDRNGDVRVLDFGVASMLDGATLTKTGEILGTPQYLPPELYTDARAVGPWTDIYCVGVLLYELLTAQLPFGTGAPATLGARIQSGRSVPLASFGHVPRDLATVIEKAMAPAPKQRYPSAAAFANDLERFVATEPVHARPVGAPTRVLRRLRHHKTGVMLAALFVAATLAAFWWSSARDAHAEVGSIKARALYRSALLTEYGDATLGAHSTPGTEYRRGAVGALLEALEADPSFNEAALHAAVLLSEIGEHSRALDLLEGLGNFARQCAVVSWATAHARSGDAGMAFVRPDGEATEETALELYYRARSFIRQRQKISEGIEILAGLSTHELLGTSATYLQGTSLTLGETPDGNSALLKLYAAQRQAPNHPVLLWNLAATVHRFRADLPAIERRAGEVEAMLEHALRENDHANLHGALGLIELTRGRTWREVRPHLERAYDRERAANHIVNLAHTHIDEAAELQSSDPRAATASLETAERLFRESLAVTPDHSFGLAGLATCLLALGKKDEAKRYAQQAASSPAPGAAARGRQVLRHLQK